MPPSPEAASIIEVYSDPANVIEVYTDPISVIHIETPGQRGLPGIDGQPGPPGPPGDPGQNTNFLGDWQSDVQYSANDSVVFEGVLYLSDGNSLLGYFPSVDGGLTTSLGWFKIAVPGSDGTDGDPGLSAYQIWLSNGNTGTEVDFLESLIGADGVDGTGTTFTYTNPALTPTALGGVSANTSFDAWPLQQVFDTMFYPYLKPAFNSFGISGQSTSVEVGSTIGGASTFTWNSSNDANVAPSSLYILEGAATLASSLPSDGSTVVAIPSMQKTSPGSRTFTIRGTDTHASSYTSSFTINWVWRLFYGTSTNTILNENQIEALAGNQLGSSGSITYSFAMGGYKYICYPDSFPSLSTIKDQSTSLSVTMADSTDNLAYSNGAGTYKYALVTLTNMLGATTIYKVYRSRYELGGSIVFVTT